MLDFPMGTIVKIKENLEIYKIYEGIAFVCSMEKYKGHVSKIVEKDMKYYHIEIDDGKWAWTDEMLELANNEEIDSYLKGGA